MNTSCKFFLCLLVFFCIIIPAIQAAPAVSLSAVAGDTSGPAPNDLSYYISEGKTAVNEGNWTEAVRVTTRGLIWFPQDPELLCLQGYAYRKTGEYQKAVESVSKAIRLDPAAVRYANRGYAYLALRNYSAAYADAEAGIAMNTSFSTNYAIKALALLGKPADRIAVWKEALPAADTAVQQSPDSAYYWQVKGRALADQRACDAAREAYRRSLTFDPDYPRPWPGFAGAQEDLAALNTTCIPVTIADDSAFTPTRASLGWDAVTILAGAIALAAVMRK